MRIVTSILITIVAMVVAFLGIAKYKPEWIVKPLLDAQGFPKIKKEGDKFISNNIVYMYSNGKWVIINSNSSSETGKVAQVIIKNNVQLLHSNGTEVGSRRQVCSVNCLEAYPVGSQYHGYYFCRKNCGSF